MNVVVLAGGFGGARMADGFALLKDDVRLSVIVNTGDDLELHGLHVSPDIDTVMYTLAGWPTTRRAGACVMRRGRGRGCWGATAATPGSDWATATLRRTSCAAMACAPADG